MELKERIIEIEVPNDTAIFHYEAGIKLALEEMIKLKNFLDKVGETDTLSRLNKAILAMNTFLETVQKVKVDIVNDFSLLHNNTEEPDVKIVPNLHLEDNNNNDDNVLDTNF